MRSLTDLQTECASNAIEFTAEDSRVDLMDKLRAKFGAFDPSMELDPMKAQDTKDAVKWGAVPDFSGIANYLNDGWACEPKIDGARARLFFGTTGNSINTGRRSDVTYQYIAREHNFPHLRDAIVADLAGTILDGELLAPSAQITTQSGVTTNSLLNATVALTNCDPAKSVATQAKFGRVKFYAFDILAFKGDDVTHLPYADRQRMLTQVLAWVYELNPGVPELSQVMSLDATAENIAMCLNNGFEGAMLKKRDAPYMPGKRSKFWQKVKAYRTGDFCITGYEPGKGSFQGLIGSVEVSYLDENDKHVAVGQVGSFDLDTRKAMTAPDGSLKVEYIGQVLEVMAQGRTKSDRLRHAHLVRFRPDKSCLDCRMDQIELFPRC